MDITLLCYDNFISVEKMGVVGSSGSPWDAGKRMISRQAPTVTAYPPIALNTPGRTNLTVPPGVSSMNAMLIGAGGSGGRGDGSGNGGGGGSGALIDISFEVKEGEIYTIEVGDRKDGPGGDTTISKGGVIIARAGGGRPGEREWELVKGVGGAAGVASPGVGVVFTRYLTVPAPKGTDGDALSGGKGGALGGSGADGATTRANAEDATVSGSGGGGGHYDRQNGGRAMAGAARVTWM